MVKSNNNPATHTDYCNGGCANPSRDFAFAFNNVEFSDKILCIQIVDTTTNLDKNWSGRSATQQKLNDTSDNGRVWDTPIPQRTTNPQNLRGRLAKKQKKKGGRIFCATSKARPVISGDEAANNMDFVRSKTLHISAPILAAMSPFFYKLFSNGMMESNQRCVTLRINASEEAALMELLNFAYSNSLSTTTTPEMLDVLMIADKFEVASCMEYCSCLLWNMPMTPDYAVLYLELPSSVLMAKVVQPLKDKAVQFLADRYKFKDEVLALCIAGIEPVLSSEDLQVETEDDVCDIALNWAKSHYPKLKDRQDIIGTRLIHFIRFPYMTFSKLKDVLHCNDLNHELSFKAVLEALLFKSGALHQQRSLVAEVSASQCRRFVERAYIYRPLKVVDFDSPRQQCVVYLELKRVECANLFPWGNVCSQDFHLGGHGIFLLVECHMNEQNALRTMGLRLGVNEMGHGNCSISFKAAARTKPTDEYGISGEVNHIFTRSNTFGYNLFNIPWASFIAKESLYFINDILHLRAEVTIKN